MSLEEKQGRRFIKEIKKQVRHEKQSLKGRPKVLVLGTGGSGKSTFIKQMRIIHGRGYSDADRKGFITLVFQNIIRAIQELIDAMKKLQIDYADDQNVNHAQKLSESFSQEVTTLEPWQVNAIRRVWNDRGVQKCHRHRTKFHLIDSAKYYLTDVDRITAPGYIPTEHDILRARFPTTGIIEYMFDTPKISFKMVDVGGVRSERKKWSHTFENVTSIIFLAAISEFDQVLVEDGRVNRLVESLGLFQTIVWSRWFEESSTIIFLNKTDLLEEKITRSHLVTYFPDYNGPPGDAESAKKFIQKKFVDVHAECQKPLHTHFTCTTDTDNIRLVFRAIRPALIHLSRDKFRLE